jgi:hypothetical protein
MTMDFSPNLGALSAGATLTSMAIEVAFCTQVETFGPILECDATTSEDVTATIVGGGISQGTLDSSDIPEPRSAALFAAGLAGLIVSRNGRRGTDACGKVGGAHA